MPNPLYITTTTAMTTTAQKIEAIARKSAACTFEYGYAAMRDSRYQSFEAGKCLEKRRNKAGRCTFAKYRYADGSTLTFRWSENSGPSFSATR